MKGEFDIEMLMIVIIALVAITIGSMWFTGEAETEQSDSSIFNLFECEIHNDCIENINGHKCIETGVPTTSVFCGCIKDEHCNVDAGKKCGDDYLCH